MKCSGCFKGMKTCVRTPIKYHTCNKRHFQNWKTSPPPLKKKKKKEKAIFLCLIREKLLGNRLYSFFFFFFCIIWFFFVFQCKRVSFRTQLPLQLRLCQQCRLGKTETMVQVAMIFFRGGVAYSSSVDFFLVVQMRAKPGARETVVRSRGVPKRVGKLVSPGGLKAHACNWSCLIPRTVHCWKRS